MLAGNDERRIDYGIVVGRAEDARIHRDERETRGTAIAFIRKCKGVKRIRESGRGHVKMQPNAAKNPHSEVDIVDGYMD
jgi:hypothetical protein